MGSITYVPEQQNPWLQQGMSYLQQLGMMKMAHNMRLEEEKLRLEQQKIEAQKAKQESAQIEGYTPIKPEDVEQGNIDPEEVAVIGGQAFKRPQPKLKPVTINGVEGVLMQSGDKVQFLPKPKSEKESAESLPMSYREHVLAQQDPNYANFIREKAVLSRAPGDPYKVRDQQIQEMQFANQLQKDFTSASKVFVEVRDSYNRIQAGAKDPSAAGDLTLIFSFMKMQDPGSTVRESEQANAQNAAGVPERIRAVYNRVLNGERLGESQRADFIKRSEMLYKEQLKSHDSLRNQYIQKAKRSGLNPEDVVIDYRNVEPKTEIPTETKSAHGSGKTLTEEQINLYKKYNIPLPQR